MLERSTLRSLGLLALFGGSSALAGSESAATGKVESIEASVCRLIELSARTQNLPVAFLLRAMGFPVSMFTVLFSVARTAGWIAQWKEMIEDPTQKIGRPRQLYIGPSRRDYVPVDQRSQ